MTNENVAWQKTKWAKTNEKRRESALQGICIERKFKTEKNLKELT